MAGAPTSPLIREPFGSYGAAAASYVDVLNDRFVAAGRFGANLPVFSPLSAVRETRNDCWWSWTEIRLARYGRSRGTAGAVAAGVLVGPNEPGWFEGRAAGYFFVPAGTGDFVVGVEPALGVRPWISVVDPAGRLVTAGHCDAPRGSVCEYAVNSPAPGIWRLDHDFRGRGTDIYRLGVSPLLWHDASHLAVPYSAASTTPLPAYGCCKREWQ